MTGIAVLIMLIAIIIIWGGLAVSVTALVSRGHREQAEDRARASAEAHEHLRITKIGRASCRERV